jgi:hypothetical protein
MAGIIRRMKSAPVVWTLFAACSCVAAQPADAQAARAASPQLRQWLQMQRQAAAPVAPEPRRLTADERARLRQQIRQSGAGER